MPIQKLANCLFCICSGLLFSQAQAQAQAQSTINVSAPYVGYSLDGAPCVRTGTGLHDAMDYTDPKTRESSLFAKVEGAHFTELIETLRGNKEKVGKNPYPDMNYTLNSIPNHHRALYSMVRLQSNTQKRKAILLRGGTPAECYLQRAISFGPSDPVPPLLYGIFLHRLTKYDDALTQYELALKLDPNNPQVYYNMGLLFADMNSMDEALKYAKLAYGMNYPLMALQNRLKKEGVWEDPKQAVD